MMGKVLALATDPEGPRWRVRWRASGGRSWRATREFYRTARRCRETSPWFKY